MMAGDRDSSPKPQLVLDIGGVLLTNLTSFWQDAANKAGLGLPQLRERYKLEMRHALWSGEAAEETFWHWLETLHPSLRRTSALPMLQNALRPLPALALLPAWSELADIHLLTNHRDAWIRPLLRPVRHLLASVTVSSEEGCFKPGIGLYRIAAARLAPETSVLYVDDKDANLAPAAGLGWRTLLADEDGRWIEQVPAMLAELGR